MENPLKNLKLKDWPDFFLSISGAIFVTTIIAMYSGNELAKYLSIGFGGLVLFSIGGKIAHYKFRDKNIKGNMNAWFSGWRHSILADSFALLGIILVIVSVWKIIHVFA